MTIVTELSILDQNIWSVAYDLNVIFSKIQIFRLSNSSYS